MLVNLLKLLHLRRDELRLVSYMMAVRFALGFTFIVVQNVAITLFLSRFNGSLLGFEGVAALPIVYILSSIGSTALGAALFMLQRRTSVGRLMGFNIALGLAVIAGFWVAVRDGGSQIAYPGFVIITQVVWVLLTLNAELISNALLNVRQARRIIGLLNGGETVAFITGAYTVAAIVRRVGVPDVLLLALSVMLAAVLAYGALLRASKGVLTARVTPEERRKERQFAWRSPFVALMVLFVTLLQFGLFATYIQSRAAINVRFDEIDIAAFIGVLQGSVGVLQAVLSFLVVQRIIARIGLFPAAGFLPLALAATGIGVLLGPPGAAFVLIIGSNAAARVLQFSFANSTTPLIYHCLPEAHKLRLQSFLSGVVTPMGAVLAGVMMLGFSAAIGGDMDQLAGLSWIVAGSGLLALPVVFLLRRQYLNLLLKTAEAKRLDVGEADFIDPTAVAFLRKRLQSTDPVEVVFAIGTLQRVDPVGLAEVMPSLVRHSSPTVRVSALEALVELSRQRDLTRMADLLEVDDSSDERTQIAALRALAAILREHAIPRVQPAIEHSNPKVRSAALAALARWGGEGGVGQAMPAITSMASSSLIEARREALQVVLDAGVEDLWPPVARLLSDEIPAVRAAAVEVVCRLRLESFYPAVVAALGNPATLASARRAIIELGEDALPILQQSVVEHHDNRRVRLSLLQLAGRIDHPAAQTMLLEAVESVDVRSRHMALTQLFDAKTVRHSLSQRDRMALLQRECRHYLEVAQMALVVRSAAESGARTLLEDSLADAMEDTLLRILFQLRFGYPADVVRTIHASWRAGKQHVALEILDNILRSPAKEMCLTLFDENPLGDKVRELTRWVSGGPTTEPGSALEVVAILCSVDRRYGDWVRACALNLATTLDLEDRHSLAEPFRDSDNPVMREIAAAALVRPGAEDTPQETTSMLSTMEKLLFLKRATIFAHVRDEYLAALAQGLEEISFDKGEVLFNENDLGDSMYIIVSGAVDIAKEGRVFVTLGPGECVGEMAVLDAEPRSASVIAAENMVALVIDRRELFEIMAIEIEIARGLFKVLTTRLREARQEVTELTSKS